VPTVLTLPTVAAVAAAAVPPLAVLGERSAVAALGERPMVAALERWRCGGRDGA